MLGVCVGMQVLFDGSEEPSAEPQEGLAEWPGTVARLEADVVPHMGWSTVQPPEGSRLFAGVQDERFYFVHSYAVREWTMAPPTGHFAAVAPRVTWAHHGTDFVAAVENGPCPRPSSTRRSPARPASPCSRTGSGPCDQTTADELPARQARHWRGRQHDSATPNNPKRHQAQRSHAPATRECGIPAQGTAGHRAGRGPGHPRRRGAPPGLLGLCASDSPWRPRSWSPGGSCGPGGRMTSRRQHRRTRPARTSHDHCAPTRSPSRRRRRRG